MPLLLPTERRLIKPSGRFVLNKDSPQAVGLVAWYPFTPGQEAVDLAGVGGFNQTPANSPPYGTNRDFGDIVDLPGAGTSRFSLARTPIVGYGCTLTAWFNKDDSTNVGWINVLYNTGDTGQNLSILARPTGEVRARKDGTGATAVNVDELTGYTVGGWDFVAGIFISSTAHAVKANGRARVNSAATDTSTISLNAMAIGYEPFSTPRNHLFGLLGDIRVYNRALTDKELDEIYDPSTRFELYYEIGRKTIIIVSAAGETPVSLAVACPFESLLGLALSAQAPMESLQAAAIQGVVPMESLQGVGQGHAVPMESLQAAALTANVPIESLLGMSLAVAVPIENLGETPVSLAIQVPMESLQGLALAAQAPIESLQGVALQAAVPMESLQGVSISAQAPIESLVGVAVSVPVPFENLLLETLVSLSVQISVENLQGAAFAVAVPIENRGPTLVYYVNVDFDFPLPVINFDFPVPVIDFDL